MTVPKIIWQWWAGPKPAPLELMATWRAMNPGFDHRIISDLTGWENQKAFDQAPGFAMKSDVVRYELLAEQGGIWVDADAECVRPLPDEILHPQCLAAYEHEDYVPGLIAGGIIAAHPGAPLMRAMVDAIAKADLSKPTWQTLGPELLTRVAKATPSQLVVWPSRTFYPFHYTGRRAPGAGEIYAFHHWGGTTGLRRDAEGRWLDHPTLADLEGNAHGSPNLADEAHAPPLVPSHASAAAPAESRSGSRRWFDGRSDG